LAQKREELKGSWRRKEMNEKHRSHQKQQQLASQWGAIIDK